MKKLILLIVLLSSYKFAFLQNSVISMTVDKQSILIGERIQLTIQVFLPNHKTFAFPKIDSMPHFDILDRSGVDTQIVQGGINMKQTLSITSWDSGKWSIPSITYQKVKTKPIPVIVSFSPFDASKPYHDIKDIIEVPKSPESNWWWYAIGAVFIIALFFLFFPGRKKHEIEEKPVSTESVYRETIKRLEKLREQHLEDTNVTLFYTTLIDIFRNYLERRKNIKSFSQTTDDLAVQLKKLKISGEDYNKLVENLQLSDMVKYARYKPINEENKEAFKAIEKSITTIENS